MTLLLPSFLWAEEAGGILHPELHCKQCTYTSNEQLWSRGRPLHNSFYSEHDHKGATEGLWVVVGLSRKQVATETVGDLVEVHVWEFFTSHISCASGELTAPLGSMKMNADPFCKSTVHNGHLSVWSVSTESRCAALQEVQGGNSDLTCTDRRQLTESCHFQRGRSVLAYKHKDVSQGQSIFCFWPHISMTFLGQVVTHVTSS